MKKQRLTVTYTVTKEEKNTVITQVDYYSYHNTSILIFQLSTRPILSTWLLK